MPSQCEPPLPAARPDSCRRPACVSVRLRYCAWTQGPPAARRKHGSTRGTCDSPGGEGSRPAPFAQSLLNSIASWLSRYGEALAGRAPEAGICTAWPAGPATGVCLTPRSQSVLHLQGRVHDMCLRYRQAGGLVTSFGQRGCSLWQPATGLPRELAWSAPTSRSSTTPWRRPDFGSEPFSSDHEANQTTHVCPFHSVGSWPACLLAGHSWGDSCSRAQRFPKGHCPDGATQTPRIWTSLAFYRTITSFTSHLLFAAGRPASSRAL